MRIYVAAAFEDALRARSVMQRLCDGGHEITHDWTFAFEQYPGNKAPPSHQVMMAEDDLDGVRRADMLLVLAPSDGVVTRGLYAELGAALYGSKIVAIVGDDPCIFAALADCWYETDEQALAELCDDSGTATDRAGLTLNELANVAHSMAIEKGWYESSRSIPELLALVHSEVSEGLEAFRNGDTGNGATVREDGKPEGLASELADVMIRVADMAGYLGIDLGAAVEQKIAFNATRPRRHGGKLA